MYWYGGVPGWGYALMVISMVLFWGLIIAGVVALVRYVGRSGSRAGGWQGPGSGGPGPGAGGRGPGDYGSASATAEDLLAQRFARGEIDEDEYRQRLAILRDRDHLAGKA